MYIINLIILYEVLHNSIQIYLFYINVDKEINTNLDSLRRKI